MSLNKYAYNTTNYPQFSLGVDTINCETMTVSDLTLPYPAITSFQKNILTVPTSSFLVSNLSDLNFYQSDIPLRTSVIYFELANFDLGVQIFDIEITDFPANVSQCVVTGFISDSAKSVNYSVFPRDIVKTSTSVSIQFIQNSLRVGESTTLLGNLIIRY